MENPLHRWLVWLDEDSPPELVEEVVRMDSAIRAANEKKYYLTQDWQERNLYLHRQLAIMDYNTEISYALEEGEQKGRQEGRQEGEQIGEQKGENNKAIEIARKALAEKLPVDVIQKITGLDIAVIQRLSS